MGLHTELVGDGRPRLAFLHGLFGRGRNWSGVAASLAAAGHASVLFDLPNHGASPWTDDFSYRQMADAVAAELDQKLGSAARVTVVGHSLGGKVAMLLALTRPELVDALAVVDIAPAPSEGGEDEFRPLIDAVQSVDLSQVTSRRQAEDLLAERVSDTATRQLLLQNLRARPHWHWQPNFELLRTHLDDITDWPDPGPLQYTGPVIWLRGERSGYVRPEHEQAMRALFPAVETRTIPDAGHWVHSDNPAAVVAELQQLVERT